MSLVGNLEDLGLGEILQIVSLSRKSGVLELNSLGREGWVIFKDGQVIRATATTFPEHLGDLVLRAGLTDRATLKLALQSQQASRGERRIGEVLASDFGIDREAIETAMREHIERVVYSFFSWNEGVFSFELGEPGEMASTNLNPLQFMLDQGLNPQWLAMEGSRILDEMRHRGEDVEMHGETLVDLEVLLAEARGESLDERAGVKAAAAVAEGQRPLPARTYLVVDDDPDSAEKLADQFQKSRALVRVFTNGDSFLDAVSQAVPETTILVIDLIMPLRDGSGVLGGLELLREVHAHWPDLPVLVMAEHPSREDEASVRELGAKHLLRKPARGELCTPEGQTVLEALVEVILDCGRKAADSPAKAPGRETFFHLGEELLGVIGESPEMPAAQLVQTTPGLHLLRGMLEELNNPALGGSIILLILRFASELMNRAVILLVKDEEIIGLGQFGIDLAGRPADARVRNTRLPKQADHVFSEALATFAPGCVKPQPGEWNDYLFTQLGGARPSEVFIGPLVSEGRVVALLYGDNLPEDTPIGDTESLEIFLSQAGKAMEKALLERRISSQNIL